MPIHPEEMQEELQILEQELAHISGHIRRSIRMCRNGRVEPGDNSGEKLGETIGSILDWAILILPTERAKAASTAAAESDGGRWQGGAGRTSRASCKQEHTENTPKSGNIGKNRKRRLPA